MKTLVVKTTIHKPIEHVWKCWTSPLHITQWNFAADSWQCPNASNDLRPGGTFSWRMEAKDGSFGFDYCGTYKSIETCKFIHKVLDDGRSITISFLTDQDKTTVTETFEAEDQNPIDVQQQGWQAILDNFKKHVESI